MQLPATAPSQGADPGGIDESDRRRRIGDVTGRQRGVEHEEVESIPPERRLVEEARRDEDRGRDVVALERRQRGVEVVGVAVVERHRGPPVPQ